MSFHNPDLVRAGQGDLPFSIHHARELHIPTLELI